MRVFCFGLGYAAGALALQLARDGTPVAGTTRSAEKQSHFRKAGVPAFLLGEEGAGDPPALLAELARATHIIHSIPPDEACSDPALRLLAAWPPPSGASAGESAGTNASPNAEAHESPRPLWLGYLSSTSVYGDLAGAEADETSPVAPDPAPGMTLAELRGARRAAHERAWQAWCAARSTEFAAFRLAGIYGPGRNPLERLRTGKARRIAKPGQVLGRIHLDDILSGLTLALKASAKGRPASGIFNLCDDEPADPAEVVRHAAELLGLPPPPLEQWDDARDTLPPMARSFYEASRRVRAHRTKHLLHWHPHHPTYREGLRSLL